MMALICTPGRDTYPVNIEGHEGNTIRHQSAPSALRFAVKGLPTAALNAHCASGWWNNTFQPG